MTSIMKSDIFFFITSIAVVVLSVLLAMIFIYFFRAIKDLRFLASKIREEGEEIVKDVKEARVKIKEKGAGVFSTVLSLFKTRRQRTKKESHKESSEK